MKLYSLVGIAALSIGAIACGGNADVTDENPVGMNETSAEAPEMPAGTSGLAEAPADMPEQNAADRRDTAARDENAALPSTASPLGLGALIGLLSLGGAAGIRVARP